MKHFASKTSRTLPLLLASAFIYKNQTSTQTMRYPNPLLTMSSRVSFAEEAKTVYLGCSLRSMMDKPGMMVLLVNTESPGW
jgi:hypothetical protein